ncbi:sodium/calcium exchanger 3-like isoform X1 [Ischnura elegans]|uniref:sodium/calcium exchanger 3-like isoform X1 n=1 Tax=Ischnura elegans TaxID=197161 RepID=UPI001ED87496|nr:sodium/calcium exchanger 3-like isoform X1 [Ischnura elegans]
MGAFGANRNLAPALLGFEAGGRRRVKRWWGSWCYPALVFLVAHHIASCVGITSESPLHPQRSIKANQTVCPDGLIIPAWNPQENLSVGDRVSRGLVYFLALAYLFIGVSIIADRFMASIEVITSQEKEVTVSVGSSGETQIVVVRVWNETVANLTLMALGSSAPEIMLSIIEIGAKNFEAGDLGPGTIVGSAAFNLFVIISYCVYVIPDGEVRKIKHLRVFFVTATWSVFAYVWLYLILAVISEGEVEVWEGLVTFLFFPLTVITAYIADRRLLIYKYLNKRYRINRRGVVVEAEGDVEMGPAGASKDGASNHVGPRMSIDGLKHFEEEDASEEVRDFEQSRREFIRVLRELRQKHPNLDMETLESMAREEALSRGPKSRAFYRMQATRKMVGSGNLMKKMQEKVNKESSIKSTERIVLDDDANKSDSNVIKIFFDPGHYTVMENVGDFEVRVAREGGNPEQAVLVDYETEDGTANAGSDYVGARGTLLLGPGRETATINLQVLDDDVFEEDEHFYVRLSNLRLANPDGTPLPAPPTANGGTRGAGSPASPADSEAAVQLVSPALATVMILDDDHGGIFSFPERDMEIVESIGQLELKVSRWSGARGKVAIPFHTEDGTAKAGKEYETLEGELVFENNETEKIISVCILEEDSYEKDVLFYVQLGEPKMLGDEAGMAAEAEKKKPEELTAEDKMALLGRPKLGEITRAQIRIKESKEFKNTVDKLVKRANASILIGTSSWKEQFIEAITVSAGDDDNDGDEPGEEKSPSCTDYVMHFVTLFWKIIFAFVPPTDHLNGWLCFCVSITWIGILTAVIGDVASHFGCTVGIEDSVTAITLVALGTSLPDTFASKVAAVQDKYADASVGNVTGSNAVNVFMGIGVAWSIAAVYHALHGDKFLVEPGNLAFSVTIFCSEAVLAILTLLIRRSKVVGGELGGPYKIKMFTSFFLLSLWFFYVIMSTLEVYDVIEGF